jgi:hypothetical protein
MSTEVIEVEQRKASLRWLQRSVFFSGREANMLRLMLLMALLGHVRLGAAEPEKPPVFQGIFSSVAIAESFIVFKEVSRSSLFGVGTGESKVEKWTAQAPNHTLGKWDEEFPRFRVFVSSLTPSGKLYALNMDLSGSLIVRAIDLQVQYLACLESAVPAVPGVSADKRNKNVFLLSDIPVVVPKSYKGLAGEKWLKSRKMTGSKWAIELVNDKLDLSGRDSNPYWIEDSKGLDVFIHSERDFGLMVSGGRFAVIVPRPDKGMDHIQISDMNALFPSKYVNVEGELLDVMFREEALYLLVRKYNVPDDLHGYGDECDFEIGLFRVSENGVDKGLAEKRFGVQWRGGR